MSARIERKKVTFRCSEHEYEPIAPPSPLIRPLTAPVVRITDTDVVPVADSDDSIDDRSRLPPELTQAVILPLDGKIEDSAMEARELVETGDTSEEQETPQQLQERLEERFLSPPTPGTESRTDGEVNTSQVDSLALEELPLRRGARGIPQRIKTQAGKLRTRLRGIQRPAFTFSKRQKHEKSKSVSSGKSDKSKTESRPSRMDRIRSSFSEKTKFSLPNRPKFAFPDRSKFHLPERPKFNLPKRPEFHLPERPKFNIKKPNIRLPNALTRAKKQQAASEEEQQRSTNSTVGSRRNIFDFSTYPRIFDRKSKNREEYTTSTPKDSRAQSAESATFPRTHKGASARWAERFDQTALVDEDRPEAVTAVERSRPWRHPSMEQPRLSLRMEEEVLAVTSSPAWEEKRRQEESEEIQYMDYDQESTETSEHQPPRLRSREESRTEDESYEHDRPELDPRLYGDQGVKQEYPRADKEKDAKDKERSDWQTEEEIIMAEHDFGPIPRSRSLGEHVSRADELYGSTFAPIDPRRFRPPKLPSEEEEYGEEVDEEEEDREPSSAQSDREQQQSSGSSCDRRRRGVIEEIDSDEFFLRESGISQDEMNLRRYLANEIRDTIKSDEINNALADDSMMPIPPQRPTRTRSLKKRKQDSTDSYDIDPLSKTNEGRIVPQRSVESGEEAFRERTRSDSRHRIVYQAEGSGEFMPAEPLDDIVVVKPMRRKSRSLQRSQSQVSGDPSMPGAPRPRSPTVSSFPPAVPTRRKRSHRNSLADQRNGDVSSVCNGHHEWSEPPPEKALPFKSTSKDTLDDHEVFTAEEIMATSQEDIQKLVRRLRSEQYREPAPIPPKRRSRSRGTSIAQDEDRTSHGAESLPEGYIEDLPRDDVDSARDLSGYAIVDKREKPPRPPPPRRRRDKFSTTPRSGTPKRPQRAYSTLGPAKSRNESILSEPISSTLEGAPYTEIDSDDTEHKDLRSGEVLSKMQRRPLPAPPRPPRIKKEQSLDRGTRSVHEFAMETTTATQTDPLPDDMVIEEEITQAKLIVAPSRSGSQVLVSTERIPSPISMHTPSVPPLPASQCLRREDQRDPTYDTASLKSPSPVRDHEDLEGRHLSAPHLEERSDIVNARALRSALLSDEPVRISSLEVGDLRVDRLSVSQIDAQKIVASEVDALLITASELKNLGSTMEENLSPAIIKELIAIRSHLENVAASQAQERHVESTRASVSETKRDIPVMDIHVIQEEAQSEGTPSASGAITDQPIPADDEKSKSNEDQKVVKREVLKIKDKEIPTTHTLSVAQIEIKDKEMPTTHTLSVSQVDIKDSEIPLSHSLLLVPSSEDKSLRILDSESPLSLSSCTTKDSKEEESPAPFNSSTQTLKETTDPSISPERTSEQTIDVQHESPVSSTELLETTTPSTQRTEKEDSPECNEKKSRKSRSRSPSPSKGMGSPVRQTASPVRSLPPVISVTPDTPDTVTGFGIHTEVQPQRAVISYSSCVEQSDRESQRESSQSPIPSLPSGGTHFIAFPVSQIPGQLYSLTGESSHSSYAEPSAEPSLTDTTLLLLRTLRIAGVRAMRHFIGYISSTVGAEDSRDKVREVELTLCALLLLIAGLLIYFFSSTRTVTHLHHWDYFNPPQ